MAASTSRLVRPARKSRESSSRVYTSSARSMTCLTQGRVTRLSNGPMVLRREHERDPAGQGHLLVAQLPDEPLDPVDVGEAVPAGEVEDHVTLAICAEALARAAGSSGRRAPP